MQRRSPTCRAIALLNLGAETGRLRTTGRWQDKREHIALRLGAIFQWVRRRFHNVWMFTPHCEKSDSILNAVCGGWARS